MARGQLDPGAAVAAKPSDSSKPPSSARPIGLWQDLLRLLLKSTAEAAYLRHRLRFVHVEDDGTFTFVCVCDDGFSDRRNWNAHITDSFSEVIDD